MINKYQAGNKNLKEYKVKSPKSGTAKNGASYTVFQVSDAKKKQDGTYEYDNYSVFTWQSDIKLEEGDKIGFEDISALEVVENEYNGKKYLKKTIFADIKILSQANPNKVEVVGDLPNIDDIGDSLPF